MKILLPLAFLLYFLFAATFVRAQALDTTMWVTDGSVSAIVRTGRTIYLGGQFSYVGPNTGSGAILSKTDGKLTNAPLLRITGTVYAVASDGNGGWFVGGKFTSVQGTAWQNLAHIWPDGTLDEDWRPAPNEAVYELTLNGNTLYASGNFTAIGGQPRQYLAALDARSGRTMAWNPGASNPIAEIAVSGNVVYVGGGFTSVGGQSRKNLAAIDAATGQVTGWNPDPKGAIYALAVSGEVVYVGGNFTFVGGQNRNYVAALDAATGLATAWNPNANTDPAPNGTVRVNTLAVSGTVIYAGGYFSTIGGQPRNNLAALDRVTGQATGWNPDASHGVATLVVSGNLVYASGSFGTIGGQNRNNVAALDAVTGQATGWAAIPAYARSSRNVFNSYAGANALAVAGNAVFVGGGFVSIGGKYRSNLAALDAATGQATDWAASANWRVDVLVASGNLLYVSGEFSSINGQNRKFLAALDALTGQLTAWNPNPDGYVRKLLVAGNLVYAAGTFRTIGGQARKWVAALDPVTGRATPWHPNPNQASGYPSVSSLAAADNVIYVGGSFTSIGGQPRNNVAAIEISTGLATAWNPNVGGKYGSLDEVPQVKMIAAFNNVVYIGGDFNMVGGQARFGFAAIDKTSGQLTGWSPNWYGGINAMAEMNGLLYVGGRFTSLGNTSRNKLAAFDPATGMLTPWNPNADAEYLAYEDVNVLIASGDVLYAGGNFTQLQNHTHPYFAAFGKSGAPANFIKGTVYQDDNGDCVKNPAEQGIANQVVVARPGNYFTSTDSMGNYTLAVDIGNYAIEQIIPAHKSHLVRQTCPTVPMTYPVQFGTPGNTTVGKDFANQVTAQSVLTVSVASSRRRRCFTGNTSITYCNMGTAKADGVRVHVKLPPYIVLVRASAPYTVDKDHNYVFAVGTLEADACGSIQLIDSVVCNDPTIRGLTQCTRAWITPANAVIPAAEWDKSNAALKAACTENGRVRLGIYNAGEGNMADSSAFRILLDAQLAFAGNYKLAKGDSLILQVPANGRTVRLEADQRPGHPTKRQSNVTLEACGTNGNGTVSKGFVAQLPQDDAEPEVAVECLPITDSFDPNDKAVSPQGVTAEKYTPTGKALDYVIRFQNTGNDVAYKVVVTDTLSEHLDLSTLQVGAVSHAYKMTVTGKGRPVLTFTFDNIMLPDSNANEPKSHGRIQFGIKPKAGLPERTRIENFADIFFDYNEPVRTNTTLNTIYDVPPVVVEAVRLDRSIAQGVPTGVEPVLASLVRVFPNPTTGKVAVVMPDGFGASVQIGVYDALGRAVCTRSVTLPAAGEQNVELDLSTQPAGVFVLKLQTPRGVVTRRVIRTGGK